MVPDAHACAQLNAAKGQAEEARSSEMAVREYLVLFEQSSSGKVGARALTPTLAPMRALTRAQVAGMQVALDEAEAEAEALDNMLSRARKLLAEGAASAAEVPDAAIATWGRRAGAFVEATGELDAEDEEA